MQYYREQLPLWIDFVDASKLKAFVELTISQSVRQGARGLLTVRLPTLSPGFQRLSSLFIYLSLFFSLSQPVLCLTAAAEYVSNVVLGCLRQPACRTIAIHRNAGHGQ